MLFLNSFADIFNKQQLNLDIMYVSIYFARTVVNRNRILEMNFIEIILSDWCKWALKKMYIEMTGFLILSGVPTGHP